MVKYLNIKLRLCLAHHHITKILLIDYFELTCDVQRQTPTLPKKKLSGYTPSLCSHILFRSHLVQYIKWPISCFNNLYISF